MKTPLSTASVSLLNSPVGQGRSGVLTDSSATVLTDMHDKDLLQLPPVHVPRKPSCSVRRTSSARFQCPVKPDNVLQIKDSALRTRSRSLVDIHEECVDTHEESVDSDASFSTTTTTTSSNTQKSHLHETERNYLNQTEKASLTEPAKRHTPRSPTTHTKLLPSREDQKKPSFGGPSPIRRHTRLYEIDTKSVPNKHPPYLKSYSQRDFSVEDEDNYLPDVSIGTRHSPQLPNRSLSVTSFLPKLRPSIAITRAKSISQPDISDHCGMVGDPQLSFSPILNRKLRVRELWRRAGQKLGVPGEDSEPDSVSWVRGPGDVLRPVYSRWSQRRNALAQPERMIMTQQARERILKEVEIRRRSVKRRVSQFLTVKLGLNMEEDLAA